MREPEKWNRNRNREVPAGAKACAFVDECRSFLTYHNDNKLRKPYFIHFVITLILPQNVCELKICINRSTAIKRIFRSLVKMHIRAIFTKITTMCMSYMIRDLINKSRWCPFVPSLSWDIAAALTVASLSDFPFIQPTM